MSRPMMQTVPRFDSYSAGAYSRTVCVYRRKPGGPYHCEIGTERRAIRPRIYDDRAARRWAHRAAEDLEDGLDALAAGRATLGVIFAAYQAHRTPRKSLTEQAADQRRALFWTRRLGANRTPYDIRLHDWEATIDERREGRICAHGLRVPHGKGRSRCKGPQPVKDRAIEADLRWLSLVFGWAVKWRAADGHYLLADNPVRGFAVPRPDPRREVASSDRYAVVMAFADQYGYLDELLPIAAGTGRRLGAILALRYSDLRLDAGSFGSIRWRSAHDKIKREAVVPIGPDVRRALDLALSRRPGIGEGWLFPAPRKRGAHVSRSVADSWLREAERAAGLTHLPGTLWHAYRRGWATARKHLPATDVAHAGGWANARTLQTVYQQPDAETLERVVLEAVELRERK